MQKNNNRGFTLVEMVVVIILIAIISATIALNWPSDEHKLYAQAQTMATDIRYTQALSIGSDTRYRMELVNGDQYRIFNAAGNAVDLPATGTQTLTLENGISYTAPINYLVFDSKGIPYSSTTSNGSGTATTSAVTITMTGESGSKNIIITPETGRVSIQ